MHLVGGAVSSDSKTNLSSLCCSDSGFIFGFVRLVLQTVKNHLTTEIHVRLIIRKGYVLECLVPFSSFSQLKQSLA